MLVLRNVLCISVFFCFYQTCWSKPKIPPFITHNKLWPHAAVYFRYTPAYPEEARETLREAMKIISDKTCIRFIEVKNPEERRPLVTIVKQNTCASTVGYFKNKPMKMFLSPKDCALGTLQHELMHVLGFWHEHTRPDRDERVTVIRKNLRKARGVLKNFELQNTWNELNTGLPYDYHSIMEYRARAFSEGNTITIQPLYQGAESLMGQRVRMTFLDIAKINRMYKCTDYYLGDDIVPLEEQ